MDPQILKEKGFEYVEKGEGPILLLLHGLFGALSNFKDLFETFSNDYKVMIPILPIYSETEVEASVNGLTSYVEDFLDYKGIKKCSIVGNSLGGHIALVFSLRRPEIVSSVVLTGSSGLFESGMGTGFPRRSNYDFIEERVGYTFYDPKTATKELVDEVFEIFMDNYKTLRIIKVARSAQRHNMADDLHEIKAPVLLIWGLNDNITPPHVAHEFNKLLPNSELRFIDKCGHAPMMEQPEEFNKLLANFLATHIEVTA